MEDVGDDFGELYADVELQASSTINGVSDYTQYCIKLQQQDSNCTSKKSSNEQNSSKNDTGFVADEKRQMNSETVYDGDNQVGEENVRDSDDDDDDDDDDFDVVVNDDDFGAKNGGADGRMYREEAVEDVEDEFVAGVTEGNSAGNNQKWVDGGGMEQSGGCYGGDRWNIGKNGCNSRYEYVRQYGSVFMGNQRALSLRRADREEIGYVQPRRSTFVPGLAEHGNGFWLPWHRTILDVNIDTFEQKPWAHPGADVTDYFNFGFDEKSWRNYCWSLDQLRQQTFTQTGSQVNESLRSKLGNEAGATKEDSKEFVDEKCIPSGQKIITSQELDFSMRQLKKQIGQVVYVEDSNTERQPSMDARRPRYRDSDVVIQITVQDQEDPSGSGKEEPDDKPVTICEMSENGSGHVNVNRETQNPGGSRAYEMEKIYMEENFQSPSSSSDLERSYKSATGSSHMLQLSSSQGKGHHSELDAPPSGKADTFSGGDPRGVETLNTSVEDADSDRNTTGTNPCVAGINFLLGDNAQSSPTSSYSDTFSETSKDDNHCDLRRTQDFRRPSSESVMEEPQVAEDDYHCLRGSKRDDIKMKARSNNKYPSRVRNSISWRHSERRVRRHSELKTHNDEDDNCHVGIAERMRSRGHSRAYHRRSEEWRHASVSNIEDWPSYRENKSSLGCSGRRSVENRFQTEYMRESDRQDHWGSRDEMDLCSQREWEAKQFFSGRRIRPMRGAIVQREFEERECGIRDGEPLFQNQPHLMRKHSSSRDMVRLNRQRDYDDAYFSKRSKYYPSLEHRYSDDHVPDKYTRANPLDDWHTGRVVETSGRGDEYFENLSPDRDYPRYIRDDDDKYWNRQTSPYIHDSQDRHSAYAERRHRFALGRDDADDSQLFQGYGRHNRHISVKGRCDRRLYDHNDAYDRQDAIGFFDEDGYFEKRQNACQPKGVNWAEDAQFDRCFDYDFCGEDMLDSFKGVPRHKRHGAKPGFVPVEMAKHKQIMKGIRGIMNDGGAKSCDTRFKMPTRATHELTGLWCRNSVELSNVVWKGKTPQSTRKFPNAGSLRNDEACAHADGRSRKQIKRKQQLDESCSQKAMEKENEAQIVEASQVKLPILNHDFASDLEEGQIPTEDPVTEHLMVKECDSEQLAQKDGLKGRLSHNQKPVSQNKSRVYDESRILESLAKMEKRRERFKDPILVKRAIDSDPKPQVDKLVEMAEAKGQRPARKRKWGGK